MITRFKAAFLGLTLAAVPFALTGCDVDVNEGPAEEAGEAIDEAMGEDSTTIEVD